MWYRLKTDNQIYTASELIGLHLDSIALVKIVGRTPSWCHYNEDVVQRQLNADVGYAIGDDGVIHKKNGGASNDAEIRDKIDQYDIGWKLWTNKEYTESLKWFLKSAYQGYAPGENMVGCQYHVGNGVDRNYAEAFKWWAKAAAQKDNCGIVNLAMCYNDGIGVQVDFRKALELYLKVPDETLNIDNLKNIAGIYEEGKTGTPDFPKALIWFRKAAARGDVNANTRILLLTKISLILNTSIPLGEKYYKIAEIYDKNGIDHLSFYWYQQSAKEGNANGMFIYSFTLTEKKNEFNNGISLLISLSKDEYKINQLDKDGIAILGSLYNPDPNIEDWDEDFLKVWRKFPHNRIKSRRFLRLAKDKGSDCAETEFKKPTEETTQFEVSGLIILLTSLPFTLTAIMAFSIGGVDGMTPGALALCVLSLGIGIIGLLMFFIDLIKRRI